jgi:preprotein translocase subunit SecB
MGRGCPTARPYEPKFQLNMNTTADEIGPDVREVLLTITLEAKQGDATAVPRRGQAGGRILDLQGATPADLKRLVGSFCPNVLFPFAREMISTLVVKGGFPNFLLPLVNFDALFAQASESPQPGLVN